MKIALDYDDTYTADPELWDAFINLAIERGHDVTVVTKRFPEREIEGITIPIIYTSKTKKIDKMPAGTIWIDDQPLGIILNDEGF